MTRNDVPSRRMMLRSRLKPSMTRKFPIWTLNITPILHTAAEFSMRDFPQAIVCGNFATLVTVNVPTRHMALVIDIAK
jgi:hypothetical protein